VWRWGGGRRGGLGKWKEVLSLNFNLYWNPKDTFERGEFAQFGKNVEIRVIPG
jgi:hypothetical protein